MYTKGYYEFSCPVETVAGYHSLEKIPHLLRRLGCRCPMIISDPGSTAAGRMDIVTAAITPEIRIGAIDDGGTSAPERQTVNRLAGVFRQNSCDAIISLGDGAVMDTARGVQTMVSGNGDGGLGFPGAGSRIRPRNPLVVIPAATGTWPATRIADPDRDSDMPFFSDTIPPDVVVLDPRMSLGLPPVIMAATAMAALSHAIEAYTCLAKNPLSDAHALLAIELIGKNLLDVIKEPDNAHGCLALAVGVHLAGVASTNAKGGMVQTLGHAVKTVCGVHPGTCMAILLPYGLEYNLRKNGHLTAQLLLPLAGRRCCTQTPAHLQARQVVAVIRQLNQRLHQETEGRHARCFKEVTAPDGDIRIPVEKLETIVQHARGDGTIFCNPEEPDHEDLVAVMSHAWAGTPLDRN